AASSARSTWRSPARSSHCWRTRATARRPGSSNAGRPGPAGIARWVRRPPTAGSSRGSLLPSFHPVRKTLANRPTDVLTVLGGDEPLCRADLLALLHELVQLRSEHLGLCTAGAGITTAVVQRLRSAGVQRLNVPFHSARRDAHDWLVGQTGALKTALRAIRT